MSIGNKLLDRVTALDRSSEPFFRQLAEAFDIASVPEDGTDHAEVMPSEASLGSNVKEEWILRWLLKRLGVREVRAGHPALHFQSWQLLKYLVARAPAKTVSRLLNGSGFIVFVQTTLEWLRSNWQSTATLSSETDDDDTLKDSELDSKKRKRGATDPENSCRHGSDTTRVFVSILSTVRQIETRLPDGFEEEQALVAEHLKLCLRSKPADAARMLGSCLEMIKHTLESKRFQPLLFDPCERLLRSALRLWNSRFGSTVDDLELVDIRSFSAHCLFPSLQLWGIMSKYEDGVKAVEQLLVTQLILPSRKIWDRMYDPSPKVLQEASGLVQELFVPLTKANKPAIDLSWRRVHRDVTPMHSTDNSNSQTGTTDEYFVDSTDPIPLLLGLVTRAIPRTPQRRLASDLAWFEAVFTQLALSVALEFEDPPSSTMCPRSIGVLGSMLRVCLEQNISPPTSKLKTVIVHFSGLSQAEPWLRCNWTQISTCIRLDPRTVLPNRPESAEKQPKALRLALDKLSSVNGSDSMVQEAGAFLLSLVDSFVGNRDLHGFLRIWRQELAVCLRTSLLSDGPTRAHDSESAWEHDSLLEAVASKLMSSLTPTLALKLARETLAVLEQASPLVEDGCADFYAALVIAECIIDGYDEKTTPGLSTHIASIYANLVKTIQGSGAHERLGWRLWRVLVKACKTWPDMYLDQSIRNCSMQLEPVMQARVTNHLRSMHSQYCTAHSYEETLMAWRFSIVLFDFILVNPSIWKSHSPKEQSLVSVLLVQMTELMESFWNKSLSSSGSIGDTKVLQQWDGKRLSITDLETLLLACVTLASTSMPFLGCLRHKELDRFLIAFQRCAFLHTLNTPGTLLGACSWEESWNQFRSSKSIDESLYVATALSKAQISSVVISLELSNQVSVSLSKRYYAFALSNLKLLRPAVVNRDDRTQMVNAVTSRIMSLKSGDLSIFQDSLSVLLRFAKNPRKSMYLVRRPDLLWEIADLYEANVPEPEVEDVAKLRQLATIVLDYYLDADTREPGVEWLLQVTLSLERCCEAVNQRFPPRVSLAMAAASLDRMAKEHGLSNRIHDHMMHERLLVILIRGVIEWLALESPLNSQILLLLENIRSLFETVKSLPTSVDSQERNSALSREEARSAFQSLEAKAKSSEPGITSNSSVRAGSQNEIQPQILVLTRNILDLLDGSEDTGRGIIAKCLELDLFHTTKSIAKHLHDIEKDFKSLDPIGKVTCIDDLVPQADFQHLHPNRFQLLRKILGSNLNPAERTEGLRKAIRSTCDALTRYLTEPGGANCLTFLCLENVVLKNSWAISQWEVDNILCTITILTSGTDIAYDDVPAGKIFLSLCSLFRALLATHRAKIGGRYHLVVDAMNGLLRCLFEPYALDGILGTIKQPRWLLHPNHDLGDTKLGASHAATYARLLETICDPSVSAAKQSSRNRVKLNDETKKARAVAGQHLQYIITEFCRHQLHGRIAPAVRRALDPGLYAIFDAMSRDVMKTASDSLDPSSRAIFKAAYDDYQRHGKWEGA